MTKLIIANWKMNLGLKNSINLAKQIKKRVVQTKNKNSVVICPSFTTIDQINKIIRDSLVGLGAQNVSEAEKGSWTGEISAEMLKEIGCKYIIVGHSERRQKLSENNNQICAKISQILDKKMIPILCVGETKEEKNNKTTNEVIKKQITECLKNIILSKSQKIIIAYEPVWAISDGKTPSEIPMIEEIENVHKLIIEILTQKYSIDFVKKNCQIIYGGSVNTKNREILNSKYINGALVGGASLKIDDFMGLVDYKYS